MGKMTTENLISFTEAAASKINEVLEEQGNKESYLRISLTMSEGGGAGYEFGLEDNANSEDTVIDSNGVKALVDSVRKRYYGNNDAILMSFYKLEPGSEES